MLGESHRVRLVLACKLFVKLILTASKLAELLRRMSAARSNYLRSTWYRAMRIDPYHDNMGSARDDKLHASLKAKTSAGYAGKENPTIEAGIDSQIDAMIQLMRKKYLSTPGDMRPLDFATLAQKKKLCTVLGWQLGLVR